MAIQVLVDFVSHASGKGAVNVLDDLANHQRADGYIPSSSVLGYGLLLFDYPAWWAIASAEYLLWSGDFAYALRTWNVLVKLMNTWYPLVSNSNSLIDKATAGYGGYGD